MAYSPVPTVTTGDAWTASNHNTYIRDNFAAGVPDIFAAKGDLAVGSGPDAAVRLGVGANGSILIADSSKAAGMRWGSLNAAAKVSKTALAVGAGTSVTVEFAAEDLDPRGMVNLATSPSRITIPSGLDGWYLIEIYINWNNTSATKTAKVYKNGAELYPDKAEADEAWQSAPFFTYLAAGDYLTLVLSHASGSAITLTKAEMSVIGVLV
jgi:hypothetical protein